MLLTLCTTHQPATDLGYLLHKHPDRLQSFDLSFGKAHVFYPEARAESCIACLLLDVEPVTLARRRRPEQSFLLSQYVNDRPYVASSFMSVAIAQVFGSAMQGRCKDRPELAGAPLPLSARIDVLPARRGERLVERLFEPLGYEVEAHRHPLDEQFPEWGESPYYSVTPRKTVKFSGDCAAVPEIPAKPVPPSARETRAGGLTGTSPVVAGVCDSTQLKQSN
jgi:3' terminal RNA ribose 2'-O-methyltransferase Hen1